MRRYRLAFLSEYLPLFTNELALLHLAAFIDSALVVNHMLPRVLDRILKRTCL